ncbi:SpoIIE family protein phosphatase [Streptomyces sp. 549]|uniref:SpoIIE family protein phosphatase n=1 Tax=Streptomyces sp. 549 TaxID=3049076 RepID=UPI0024C28735|nr:SpoIIE family protein phosphatase [Streptomyces sp. 549]MDK1474770.1 SpoIIE family protein phosphatase [Streptomyces sp. 549]
MSASEHGPYTDPPPGTEPAVLVLDALGAVRSVSPGAAALTGRPAAALRGLPLADLLTEPGRTPPAEDAESPAERLADRPMGVDTQLRHPGGPPVAVRVTGVPLEDGLLVTVVPLEQARRTDREQALLRELFEQTAVGFTLHDEELRVVRRNRAPGPLVQEDQDALLARLREVADTGGQLIGWEHPARLRHDPAGDRAVSLAAYRLSDPAGRVIGVASVSTDVTEQRADRRRLALLHAASERIGRSLDVTSNAEELVRVLLSGLGDLAAVDLTETVLVGGEPGDFRAGAPLRRVAAAHNDGPWPEELYPVGETFRIEDVESERLRSGTPVFTSDLARLRSRYGGDRRRTRLVLPDAATSLMVVPLQARGLVLGAVALWRTGDRTGFTARDAALAEEITSRAALSVDNARRYTREHRSVEALQRSLLPQPVVETSAADTAGVYVPAGTTAGTGGTWYDVISLSSAQVAFVVGDVAAHGLDATATMGRLRTAVQTLADLDLPPEELLTHLDDLAVRLADPGGGTAARPAAGVLGATCLYCVYDPVTGRCAMASAGRMPPLLAGPDGGDAAPVALKPGPPLGMGGKPFEPLELQLEPGSVLAFGSDELMLRGDDSHRRGDDGGTLAARIGAAAMSGRTPAETGRDILRQLLPEGPPDNEVALLMARVRRLPEEATASWTFPAEAVQVARARDLVNERLDLWGLTELAFVTELIVSELVTNSIRYAGGPVGVRLIKDETLVCEVSDPSQTQPHLRRARVTDEGGRGLFLVAQLAHRWGSRYTSSGKTMWTEQLLDER